MYFCNSYLKVKKESFVSGREEIRMSWRTINPLTKVKIQNCKETKEDIIQTKFPNTPIYLLRNPFKNCTT